jgi:5-oxopent-3-ene-1,2,5-tricarboxylate decarboxylase/2-hydroxyhepta-2,4-diene-1,7-dioate isomerase
MRRARFLVHGRIHEGIVAEDGKLLDEAGRAVDEREVVWLPPVDPPKAIGLALNFADHAGELELATPEAPALFFKPQTSLIGHRQPIVAPGGIRYMHYEAELVAAIGRRGKKIRAGDAMEYVRGYTIGNDFTIRDFVGNYFRPPVKAKGMDTFGPLGPWVVEGEIDDPNHLELRTFVNGELRQRGNTELFVHKIPQIIEYVSDFMTLEADDLIWTGTPKGISHVYPGDLIRIEIDRIGALENPVIEE